MEGRAGAWVSRHISAVMCDGILHRCNSCVHARKPHCTQAWRGEEAPRQRGGFKVYVLGFKVYESMCVRACAVCVCVCVCVCVSSMDMYLYRHMSIHTPIHAYTYDVSV